MEFTYDVPRIEVRLLGADGEPWAGPIDTGQSAFLNRWGDPGASTTVKVVPTRPYDGRVLPATDDPAELSSSHAPSNGLVRFDLDYGNDVLVAVHGGSADERFPVTPIHVRMDAGDSLCEVVVRAQREVALGRVEIEAMVTTWSESFVPTVFGEEPKPTFDGPSPLFAHGDSYLVIEDAGTGLAIAHPNAQKGGAFTADLPPGRYVARVGWRVRARMRSDLRLGSPHGGAIEPFSLEAGETTNVRIEAGAGAASWSRIARARRRPWPWWILKDGGDGSSHSGVTNTGTSGTGTSTPRARRTAPRPLPSARGGSWAHSARATSTAR